MKRISSVVSLAGALAAATAMASPAMAGPAVATDWKTTTLALKDCKSRAAEVIRDAGFGRLEFTRQSVFGTREDYTATIRCVDEKAIVLFIVSGPQRPEVGRVNDSLFKNF